MGVDEEADTDDEWAGSWLMDVPVISPECRQKGERLVVFQTYVESVEEELRELIEKCFDDVCFVAVFLMEELAIGAVSKKPFLLQQTTFENHKIVSMVGNSPRSSPNRHFLACPGGSTNVIATSFITFHNSTGKYMVSSGHGEGGTTMESPIDVQEAIPKVDFDTKKEVDKIIESGTFLGVMKKNWHPKVDVALFEMFVDVPKMPKFRNPIAQEIVSLQTLVGRKPLPEVTGNVVKDDPDDVMISLTTPPAREGQSGGAWIGQDGRIVAMELHGKEVSWNENTGVWENGADSWGDIQSDDDEVDNSLADKYDNSYTMTVEGALAAPYVIKTVRSAFDQPIDEEKEVSKPKRKKSVSNWTCEEVCVWLRSIGPICAQYEKNFINGEIDGDCLMLCEDENVDGVLIDLGVENRAHRLKLRSAIKQLNVVVITV